MGLVSSSETINRRTTGFNWLGVACGEWGRDMCGCGMAEVWRRKGLVCAQSHYGFSTKQRVRDYTRVRSKEGSVLFGGNDG